MDFPADRFTRAGATPDELAALKAQFDTSSPAAQQSQLDQIAPLSDYALAEMLEARRAPASAAEVAPVELDDPDPAVVDPLTVSSAQTQAASPGPAVSDGK